MSRAIKRIIADYNAGEEAEAASRSGSAAGLFGTSSAELHPGCTNFGTFFRKGALQSGVV